MKKLLLLFAGLTVFGLGFAQAPASFKYQAVARDGSGAVLANESVSFRISIQQGTVTGAIVYTERHYTTTNEFGRVNLEIGKGTVDTGTIEGINWGADAHFLKVEMDAEGGNNFQWLGSSQLLSVPYALHAKTVQTGDNWGTQVAATEATLGGSGTGSAPLKIAQQGAVNGQALKWNGTQWAPADDFLGNLTLPFNSTVAISGYAFNVINNGSGSGIRGEAANSAGSGVYGQGQHIGVYGSSSTATGEGIGAYGQSFSFEGNGVYGYAGSTSGTTFGVRGSAISPKGSGVFGEAPFIGVSGSSTQASGAGYGVLGTTFSNNGTAVMGQANAVTGMNYGIYGKTMSPSGYSGYFEGGSFYISGNTGIGKDPVAGSGILQVGGGEQAAISARSISNDATLNLRNDGSGTAAVFTAGNSQGLNVTNNSSDFYTAFLTNSGSGPGLASNTNSNFALFGTNNSNDKATLYLWNRGTGPAADLRSKIKIADGTEGSGKVLTSDATGLASWLAPSTGPWLQNLTAIYYNGGRVGIGTTMPAGQLHIASDSGIDLPNLLLTETGADYARIMFKNTTNTLKSWTLSGFADASDANSRLNFYYSNGLVAGTNLLSITGSGEVQHYKTGDAHVLPIAFGSIRYDARIISGTGNYTCTWNATFSRYEITITNETYIYTAYATVVTPVGDEAIFATTNSGAGKLIVYIHDITGVKVQGDFHFITHKE
ncbi:MAG: hypothetical protein NTV01_05475 [Bacteroidia bacterium]|nr:hypothetical protein [Bacteroidia bacterium]